MKKKRSRSHNLKWALTLLERIEREDKHVKWDKKRDWPYSVSERNFFEALQIVAQSEEPK